jgi:hypothetical protein
MGKGHVRVYVRTRPSAQPASGFKCVQHALAVVHYLQQHHTHTRVCRALKDGETVTISHIKEDLAGVPATEPETASFKVKQHKHLPFPKPSNQPCLGPFCQLTKMHMLSYVRGS